MDGEIEAQQELGGGRVSVEVSPLGVVFGEGVSDNVGLVDAGALETAVGEVADVEPGDGDGLVLVQPTNSAATSAKPTADLDIPTPITATDVRLRDQAGNPS